MIQWVCNEQKGILPFQNVHLKLTQLIMNIYLQFSHYQQLTTKLVEAFIGTRK